MEATAAESSAELENVRAAPADEGELEVERGLVGDSWSTRGKNPNRKTQLTLMSARAAALIAGDRERWALAGDQLYVDLDLSGENLPPGTRLAIGPAVVEVTDLPHLGCGKFEARYGSEARELVNSPEGVAINLRGINTRVVQGGTIRRGDAVRKLS